MELKTFRSKGKMYHFYSVEGPTDPEDLPEISEYKDSGYQIQGLAFDIETTSFEDAEGNHKATMYCWQFGIDSNTYIGRTWPDFISFIEALNRKVEGKNITLLVLDHNFSFEFSFIKGWFHWNIKKGKPDIFAKSDREIIYARYKNIEFRDTLALTGMPLKAFQKNFKLKTEKLVGDLDYSLKRGSTSKIENFEYSYCINDVQILTEFYNKYIIPQFLDQKKRIPLTSTGIVRQEMKELFDALPKEERRKYRKFIRFATPNEQLYTVIRQYLFRGGLTHANTSLCNAVLEESAASYDLKSAHPSSMLREKFPGKFYRVNKRLFRKVYEECKTGDFSFIACFKFKNIRAAGWHCLESKNKLVSYSSDAIFENGRLAFASEIEVVLTEIDFGNYEKMYTWEKMQTEYLYEAKKDYLPDFLRKMVCRYFELKETLPKDSLEYGLAKRKLNGLFGMCATGIVSQEIIFDEETNNFTLSGEIKDYYKLTNNLLLLPQTAVYVAAYTRRDIVDLLYITGPDSCYYDTDSDKILHYKQYENAINDFNARRMLANSEMNLYDFNPAHFSRIGCFELEYITDPYGLKVLGAKRYIVQHDGQIQVTVAGMVKGSLEAYCEEQNKNIWDEFRDGLRLPPEYSRKKTTAYTDSEIEGSFVDYNGEEQFYYEKSCVAIFDIPFEMNVEAQFLQQVLLKAEERKNQFYKGVL